MKHSVNQALGTMSLILIGALGISNTANAAQLTPGKINISWDAGIFFQNNVIDFVNPAGKSSIFGGPINPGSNGNGTGNPVPTLGTPNASKGNFTVTFATQAFSAAGFGNARGSTSDIFVPPALLGSTGGKIINDFEYNLTTIGGPSSQLLLEFDRNANGLPDAKYSFTSFLRTATPDPLGGFNSQVSLKGFFEYINDGATAVAFDKTDSVISLFNGATEVNPNTLAVVADPLLFPGSNPQFLSLDGTITTESLGLINIPEGSNTFGLLAFFSMIALGGFAKKQLNK